LPTAEGQENPAHLRLIRVNIRRLTRGWLVVDEGVRVTA